jgi:hypothetical protein
MSENNQPPQNLTRLSVNINDETARALRELSARKDLTITEIIRRSVSVYKYFEDEVNMKGSSVELIDASGNWVTKVKLAD